MIYNIIFLLKLRKYIFNLYQENRLYKFSIDSNPNICDIEAMFDTESKLVFAYLKNTAFQSIFTFYKIFVISTSIY